jgi:hypothetical protein
MAWLGFAEEACGCCHPHDATELSFRDADEIGEFVSGNLAV